ncbi:LuxR family transcriptional regulator [Chitiniphilus shinanonensis]|uniref:LuxR family transcriptional regulator n=1 Tax=Chitiniphilus shinanonensis TaxID=553088 RepID=A0ABQ6BLG1_9NEIS|nr:autoinducer binding domain-containing protein [Chitiniphilus shinanonensis]GLS02860.1 LuxR family transcriptional regulator [Chitiniphilus shinanonensis]
MKSWAEDLLSSLEDAQDELQIFQKIEKAAAALGFDFVAHGMRLPLPLSNPRTFIQSNYPDAWRERYLAAGYLETDPSVLHGRQSQAPLVWSREAFQNAPQLWEEANDFGLRVGWAQSSLDAQGVGSMLTLARSGEPLTPEELAGKEFRMRWLVNMTHLALASLHKSEMRKYATTSLTAREIEILKWTGDGKTSGEISDILAVSENTVNFHIKNAVAKLQTANKTAAVVRAAMMGLLN